MTNQKQTTTPSSKPCHNQKIGKYVTFNRVFTAEDAKKFINTLEAKKSNNDLSQKDIFNLIRGESEEQAFDLKAESIRIESKGKASLKASVIKTEQEVKNRQNEATRVQNECKNHNQEVKDLKVDAIYKGDGPKGPQCKNENNQDLVMFDIEIAYDEISFGDEKSSEGESKSKENNENEEQEEQTKSNQKSKPKQDPEPLKEKEPEPTTWDTISNIESNQDLQESDQETTNKPPIQEISQNIKAEKKVLSEKIDQVNELAKENVRLSNELERQARKGKKLKQKLKNKCQKLEKQKEHHLKHHKANCNCSYHTELKSNLKNLKNNSQVLYLVSSDGVDFIVNWEITKISSTIKAMLERLCLVLKNRKKCSLLLPTVESGILRYVLRLLNMVVRAKSKYFELMEEEEILRPEYGPNGFMVREQQLMGQGPTGNERRDSNHDENHFYYYDDNEDENNHLIFPENIEKYIAVLHQKVKHDGPLPLTNVNSDNESGIVSPRNALAQKDGEAKGQGQDQAAGIGHDDDDDDDWDDFDEKNLNKSQNTQFEDEGMESNCVSPTVFKEKNADHAHDENDEQQHLENYKKFQEGLHEAMMFTHLNIDGDQEIRERMHYEAYMYHIMNSYLRSIDDDTLMQIINVADYLKLHDLKRCCHNFLELFTSGSTHVVGQANTRRKRYKRGKSGFQEHESISDWSDDEPMLDQGGDRNDEVFEDGDEEIEENDDEYYARKQEIEENIERKEEEDYDNEEDPEPNKLTFKELMSADIPVIPAEYYTRTDYNAIISKERHLNLLYSKFNQHFQKWLDKVHIFVELHENNMLDWENDVASLIEEPHHDLMVTSGLLSSCERKVRSSNVEMIGLMEGYDRKCLNEGKTETYLDELIKYGLSRKHDF